MENGTRMLSNLIRTLEDVDYNLKQINNESTWVDCPPPQDRHRSYTIMKHVLSSLVKKTIDGKNQDEDIALIYIKSNNILDEQPQFQNLISSEEYLIETKKLVNLTPSSDVLHSHLETFHELLGDILYSACQINNYQMKLPSGILVKDLLVIENQYISIWDSICSILASNKFGHRHSWTINHSLNEDSLGTQNVQLQRSLQLSLKEMSKVKLEIEHYFRFNIIEMQFSEPEKEFEVAYNVPSKSEKMENNTGQYNNFLSTETNIFNIKDNMYDDLSNNGSFITISPDRGTYNPPTTLFPITPKQNDPKQNDINSYLFPPNRQSWKDCYDSKSMEETCGDYFTQPIIYPQDFLFFDPTNVFITSKIGSPQNHSLPKIYSVDSMNEEINNQQINYNKNKNPSVHEENMARVVQTEQVEGENTENIPSENSTVEDLFSDNVNVESSQSPSTDLQSKVSSLFNMLRTNKINDGENIFDAVPLKIENSDLSCSKTFRTKKILSNIKKKITGSKILTHAKHDNNQMYNFNYNNVENNDPHRQNEGKSNKAECNTKNKSHYTPYTYKNIGVEYPVKLSPSCQSDVIYDKKSLIELFRTTELNHGSGSGSYPQEESSFCMWPVEAEYIHVSKGRRENGCHSASSDNSISLAKSFEKSYFSLHLNKRYEQKQLYDGDLIVLDNPQTFKKEKKIGYSLLNESYVLFDADECAMNKRSSVNQPCPNYHDEHSKVKNIQVLPCTNRAIQKEKKGLNMNKDMTVQYADCGDSFVVKKPNLKRENFDFLKINGYDDNNNWNSYISIFTSKFGPSTRINHHRMFRKIINNIGTEPRPANNLFSNVHTLTSNGSPFRLFDLNGYPLTDSSGNVLKDPYGKSVVQFDSTGFPKNDVIVFDAAGNSPRDINFDPTQKPKANSIVIKLTDNFKKPLHLFDKYGRPLTDSYGKLLVTIHGRPLLRFDNFGRPNTDYRGGPLYTDNGFRWSYKANEILPRDQLSNETVKGTKLNYNLQNEQMEDSCEPINLEKKHLDSDKQAFKNSDIRGSDGDKITPLLKKSNSDIWIKVESILQHLSKKKKIEPKASQTNLIVNNISVTQTPIEKEFLKSIIYHNNNVQQDSNKKYTNNFNSTYDNAEQMNVRILENRLVDDNKHLIGHQNHGDYITKDVFLESNQTGPIHFPLYDNVLVKKTCSKCILHSHMHQQQPEYFMFNNILKDKNDFIKSIRQEDRGLLNKNGIVTTSTSKLANDITNVAPKFTYKTNDYLNNLCNEILKHKIDNKSKVLPPINSLVKNKIGNWTTDTSITEYTSSDMSKYTPEFPTHTDSTVVLIHPQRKHKNYSKNTKEQEEKYNYKYRKHKQNSQCLLDNMKLSSNYVEHFKKKNVESTMEQKKSQNKKQTNEKAQKESFQSSSKEAALDINVLNEEDRHYEIKVAERVMGDTDSKEFSSSSDKRKVSGHSSNDKMTQDSELPKLDESEQKRSCTMKHLDGVQHGKKYHYSKIQKNKLKDSPFRFSSEDEIESTLAVDNTTEINYVRTKNSDLNCNTHSKRDIIFHSREHEKLINFVNNDEKFLKDENSYEDEMKYQNYYEKTAPKGCEQNQDLFRHKKNPDSKNDRKDTNSTKKQAPSNKECNLVSFLGSPVKYVLNKLDSKRLSRPYNVNKISSMKHIKKNVSKGNIIKSNHPETVVNKNKHINETRMLHNTSKMIKKEMSSGNEKTASNNKTKEKPFLKERSQVLAFQSKSCTELLIQNKMLTMSYSGNENGLYNTNNGNRIPPHNTQLRRSTSISSYVTWDRPKGTYPLQRTQKYQANKSKCKNEQSSYKTKNAGKCTSPYRGTEKNTKHIKNQSNARYPKWGSSKNKPKEMTTYKKLEAKGKIMSKQKK